MGNEVLLAVDTSTSAGSVAVCRGETFLGEVFLNVKRNHTDRLLLTIQTLLSDLEISLDAVDAFAVVTGPGSFTGLRVGVATVKGLAMATGKPLVGISSLRGLAMQAPFCRFPICAMLDARKKEVYAALFEWEGASPVLVGEELVVPPEQLLRSLGGEYLFLGDGAWAYKTLVVRILGDRAHFPPWPLNPLRASSILPLGLDDLRQGRIVSPEALNPHYIRPSEAEIMWAKRQEDSSIQG